MIFFLRATRFFGLTERAEDIFLMVVCVKCFWVQVCLGVHHGLLVCWQDILFQDHPPAPLKNQIKWSSLNITCGLTDRYHPISLMLKIITKHKRLPKQQYINISSMESKLVFSLPHLTFCTVYTEI